MPKKRNTALDLWKKHVLEPGKSRAESLGTPFGTDPGSHAKRRTEEVKIESTDFRRAAEETTAAQQRLIAEQTRTNRPNIRTQYGEFNWTQDPNGNWSLQQSMSPELKGHWDKLSAEFGRTAGTPFDFNMGRQEAEDALYQRHMMRLNPEYQTREAGLQAQLGAAGYDPTSSAYRAATRDLAAQRVGANEMARLDAIAGGGDEARQNFAMQMDARNLPLQQMGTLFGFGTYQPGFNTAGVAQGPDYLQAEAMKAGLSADQLARMQQEWAANTDAALSIPKAAVGAVNPFGALGNLFGGGGNGTATNTAAPTAGNAMASYSGRLPKRRR